MIRQLTAIVCIYPSIGLFRQFTIICLPGERFEIRRRPIEPLETFVARAAASVWTVSSHTSLGFMNHWCVRDRMTFR